MKDVLNFIWGYIVEHWETVGLIIYEIIARVWPTKYNISILDNVWKIVNFVMENKRKASGHEQIIDITKNNVPVNNVKAKVTQHVLKTLLILFMFGISFASSAQNWQAFKGVWLKNYAIPSAIPARPTGYTQIASSGNGTLWGYDSAGRFNLRGSGGSGTLTGAANGLHLSTDGTKVRLGGTIINDTIIGGAGLTFSGTTLTINPTTWNVQKAPTITAGQKFVFVPSATTSGMNVGSIASNPTVLADGDLYYNSATGVLSTRIIGVTYGVNHMVSADFPVSRVPFNHANANGRLTSDADFSFNTTGNVLNIGDLNMGNASLAGATRTITATGSATDVGLNSVTKGAGTIQYTFGTGDGLNFSSNQLSFSNSTGASTQTIAGGRLGVNGTTLSVNGANGTTGNGGAVIIKGGDGGTGNTNGGNVTITPGVLSGSGTNGYIILSNLPTSVVGLPTGAVWNNAGVLSIAP